MLPMLLFFLFMLGMQSILSRNSGFIWILLVMLSFIISAVTTMLGWVAVWQIRRSAGRLHGLGLAVFNGLCFPLLILDLVIMTVTVFFLAKPFEPHFNDRIYHFLSMANPRLWITVIGILCIDWFIFRQVWRGARKPLAKDS